MYVDRRGFLRIGLGGFATMFLAGAGPILSPSTALAVAGVDDAVVGGLVLVMLTLAGYAVSDAVSDATLQAMGYSFGEFAADLNNQSAAVGRAIADANNLGVEVNRANAESAAAVIGAGTGAFAEWVTDAAESGRIAIDGWLSGLGGQQAALWGLVAEFYDACLGALPTCTSQTTFAGNSSYGVSGMAAGFSLAVTGLDAVLALAGSPSLNETPTWAILQTTASGSYRYLYYGTGALPFIDDLNVWVSDNTATAYKVEIRVSDGYLRYMDLRRKVVTYDNSTGFSRRLIGSSDIVSGPLMPGVDRAADAPETYGAGYDKTPIGADATYGQDGAVVNPGTIALPIRLPGVDVPYAQGLYGATAGVVPGVVSFPLSGETGVVVGTPEGVVTMPISDAVAGDTSISASVPVVPDVPVVPEGTPDVGPWTPGYNLPFYEVWPFNLVYTFVQQLSTLGGLQ